MAPNRSFTKIIRRIYSYKKDVFLISFAIIKLIHQVIEELFDFPIENGYDRIISILHFVDEAYSRIICRGYTLTAGCGKIFHVGGVALLV